MPDTLANKQVPVPPLTEEISGILIAIFTVQRNVHTDRPDIVVGFQHVGVGDLDLVVETSDVGTLQKLFLCAASLVVDWFQ